MAVFGAGLVGSAVVEALACLARLRPVRLPLEWGAGTRTFDQLEAIDEAIGTLAARGISLRYLWSAGRAGFGATEEETAAELETFQAVLRMAERHARRFPAKPVAFHLVSSAGGLFEGQRCVNAGSVPRPRRPYGLLKLRQEELLLAGEVPIRRIYRLSSVYGYLRAGRRWGLVTTLLVNGVHQRVTSLTGRMSTLRDFVFVDDVAFQMAPCILDEDGCPGNGSTLVASGRACTLLEVQKSVEATLGRQIFVAYSLDPSNSADITFSTPVAPAARQPSDLRTGLMRVYRDALGSGALFSAATARRS